MIQYRNPQPLTTSKQPLGHSQILVRRLWISGRMIVGKNHRRCCTDHGRPKNLAGMDDTRRQRTDADDTVADQSMSNIQHQQAEVLPVFIHPAPQQMLMNLSC